MSQNEYFDGYQNENENDELFNPIDAQYTVLTPVMIANEEDYYTVYQVSTPAAERNELSGNLLAADENESPNNSKKLDPFSPECRIPIPGEDSDFPFLDNKTFVRRRNERERTRVRNVNEGFERLRQHLPITQDCQEKRASKVETLRLAIKYIKHLEDLLRNADHS
ncbi:uncharacterized protein B4U79_02625 [Dinothrombium tinctorium]|uniref:BHLH domain-containing protein n=1 Tax=Dinothrombium tinctorium TaxID=1965070 RepID=A0A3S3NY61_9ACAR|nr:uncharacterized protein B4U79_02625 [Dinothrombium tinctorium]